MKPKNPDGPYIFYTNYEIECIHINEEFVITKSHYNLEQKQQLHFTCKSATTKHQFSFQLKEHVISNINKFSNVESIFAVSDIEGNFKSFTKLLINHHIVDEELNWIFKKGHLVILGDVFDRKYDVIACLWLIYKLEAEAEKVDGKVHFLLGNHEILNLSGDVRYVRNKYLEFSQKINIDYKELFSESTELGKWIRTKATVIIINNCLYSHAGISSNILSNKLSIDNINQLIRIYLAFKTSEIPIDQKAARLLFGNQGPLWYRGYFLDYKNYYQQIEERDIDTILSYFKVEHLIVGHTTFEKIHVSFNKKIIAIDINKAEKPNTKEALFIDKNKYFRAKQNGKKMLLFNE